MNDKIQMTEEQARDLFKVVSFNGGSYEFIQMLKKHGYIIKSDLQQKVEEAEEMYLRWQRLPHDDTLSDDFKMVVEFHKVFQAFKSTHPEFKK